MYFDKRCESSGRQIVRLRYFFSCSVIINLFFDELSDRCRKFICSLPLSVGGSFTSPSFPSSIPSDNNISGAEFAFNKDVCDKDEDTNAE